MGDQDSGFLLISQSKKNFLGGIKGCSPEMRSTTNMTVNLCLVVYCEADFVYHPKGEKKYVP